MPMHGYYSETDREVGKTLLEYWTNFVKTGKPTTKLWAKFDSESMQRLQIDSEGEVSLESLHGNTMVKSWLKLYNDNRKQFSIHKNSQKSFKRPSIRLFYDMLTTVHHCEPILASKCMKKPAN